MVRITSEPSGLKSSIVTRMQWVSAKPPHLSDLRPRTMWMAVPTGGLRSSCDRSVARYDSSSPFTPSKSKVHTSPPSLAGTRLVPSHCTARTHSLAFTWGPCAQSDSLLTSDAGPMHSAGPSQHHIGLLVELASHHMGPCGSQLKLDPRAHSEFLRNAPGKNKPIAHTLDFPCYEIDLQRLTISKLWMSIFHN